jgi:hypothetical protein
MKTTPRTNSTFRRLPSANGSCFDRVLTIRMEGYLHPTRVAKTAGL